MAGTHPPAPEDSSVCQRDWLSCYIRVQSCYRKQRCLWDSVVSWVPWQRTFSSWACLQELSRTKACIQSTQSTSIFTKDNLTKRFTICSMHTASQLSKPDAIKHTKSEELMTVSDVCSILWEGGNTFCPLLYLQWAFHRLARITIPLTNRVFCGQARPDVRFENKEILPNQMRSLHCKALEGISRSQKALPLCGESFNIPEQEQVMKSFFWFAGACEREMKVLHLPLYLQPQCILLHALPYPWPTVPYVAKLDQTCEEVYPKASLAITLCMNKIAKSQWLTIGIANIKAHSKWRPCSGATGNSGTVRTWTQIIWPYEWMTETKGW